MREPDRAATSASRRRPLLAGLAMGAWLTVSACGGAPPPAPTEVPPTSPPTATPTPVPPTPTRAPTVAPTATRAPVPTRVPAVDPGEVRRMGQAWADARSYRMRAQATSAGQAFDMTIEEVKPDRERLRIAMGPQTVEVIHIGSDTYANLFGQWTKNDTSLPLPMGQLVRPDDMVRSFEAAAATGNQLTKGPLSTVEGVPCQEWTQASVTGGPVATFCVGTEDNLPHRIAVTTPTAGLVTLTFSDWNTPISIEPPI